MLLLCLVPGFEFYLSEASLKIVILYSCVFVTSFPSYLQSDFPRSPRRGVGQAVTSPSPLTNGGAGGTVKSPAAGEAGYHFQPAALEMGFQAFLTASCPSPWLHIRVAWGAF